MDTSQSLPAISAGLSWAAMKACVPLIVAMLCELLCGGKSLLVWMTGVLQRAGAPGREREGHEIREGQLCPKALDP